MRLIQKDTIRDIERTRGKDDVIPSLIQWFLTIFLRLFGCSREVKRISEYCEVERERIDEENSRILERIRDENARIDENLESDIKNAEQSGRHEEVLRILKEKQELRRDGARRAFLETIEKED